MTFEEHRGADRGPHRRLVGDGNKSSPSWVHAAARFDFALASHAAGARSAAGASGLGEARGRAIRVDRRPGRGREGADCVVTDCWVSMGDERAASRRHNLLQPYQVDARLMEPRQAGRDLHALPAGASRRGGHRRGHRRPAVGRLRRGREPAPRAEGHPRLVLRTRSRHEAQRWPGRTEAATTSFCRSRSRRSTLRGRVVRLGPAIDAILDRHDYPPPVCRVLGEAVVLDRASRHVAKFEGRFQLQTKTDGPIEMIVVDFDAPDRLRATRASTPTGSPRSAPAPGRPRDAPRPGHPRDDDRPGLGAQPLPGRRGARGPGLRGGGAPVFPPVGADPDAGAARRRRGVQRRPPRLAGRRPHGSVPAGLARAHAPGGPAARRHSRGPSLARGAACRRRGRRLGRGEGARRHDRGPRARRPGALRASACSTASSTSAACASSSRCRSTRNAAARASASCR